ncbi:hypothetical protein [Thermomonospora cellulosilytica]|uniref:Uncharacterized protein n=1 Tax=Thermomonospora cellulosilytica TaxID=1411118 RepID=A0A7W3N1Q6_9ACTN|nr:hypothetical protein [Thermomonospora cellulosilytica]MBA9005869.1 hypothetical protein [Thermomonospora cellulosilytica]
MQLRPPDLRRLPLPHRRRGGVVEQVRRDAAQAAQLAAVTGQSRLEDPRLHPRLRGMVDRLRTRQHRLRLRAQHQQAKRRVRVAVRQAADAEQTLRVLRKAKETHAPYRSLLALHRGRRSFLAFTVTAALLLGAGSATGVAALADRLGMHPLAGWVAELGLIGLTTAVILYRSHLARYSSRRVTGWQNWALWTFTFAPLGTSIAANVAAAGVLGMACSVGAALWSVFAHIVADQSAEAMHDQAQKVTAVDEERLHALAVADDVFTTAPAAAPAAEPVPPVDPGEVARVQAHLAGLGVDLPPEEIARYLPAPAQVPARGPVQVPTSVTVQVPVPPPVPPAAVERPAAPAKAPAPVSAPAPVPTGGTSGTTPQNQQDQNRRDRQDHGDQDQDRRDRRDHGPATAANDATSHQTSSPLVGGQLDVAATVERLAAARSDIPRGVIEKAVQVAVTLNDRGDRITWRDLRKNGVSTSTQRLNYLARELREATGQEPAQTQLQVISA